MDLTWKATWYASDAAQSEAEALRVTANRYEQQQPLVVLMEQFRTEEAERRAAVKEAEALR